MSSRKLKLTGALICSLTGMQAYAALDAQSLVAACRNDNPASEQVCKTYIGGFLDGAQATDPAVAVRVIDEAEEMSPWMRRAIATRVGSRMLESGESFYADFCVVDENPISAVYNKVRARKGSRLEQRKASTFLYEILKDEFPCEPIRK